MQNEVASFGREVFDTTPQTLHAAVEVPFVLRRRDARLRRVVERTHLLEAVPGHFPENHPCDADAVGRDVADLFTVPDLSGAPVDGLVGILVWRGTSAPHKE